MQFTTPIQQLTTCPQCDNVVRIDAEICNICGKRLKLPTGTARSGALPAAQPLISQAGDEEDDEYEEDEEDWFGEGSGFESGEDLAAMLFAMVNIPVPPGLRDEPAAPRQVPQGRHDLLVQAQARLDQRRQPGRGSGVKPVYHYQWCRHWPRCRKELRR